MDNGYEILGKTKRYALVKVHGTFRVENLNGMYVKEVPHVEIPKPLSEQYLDYLFGHAEAEPGYKREEKANNHRQFDLECDEMFDHEHTVLYPESVSGK